MQKKSRFFLFAHCFKKVERMLTQMNGPKVAKFLVG